VPLGGGAGELPLAQMARYGSARRTPPTVRDLSDLHPGDWAYGALLESCGVDGALRGQGPLSRWEAAVLLNTCLKQATAPTDQLQALQEQFQQELTQLEGRLDQGEERLEELETQAFSSTTTLSGQAIFQLQADGFGGSSLETIQANRRDSGAFRMAYDVDLYLNTSFRGKDVLSVDTTLNDLDRSGGTGESTPVVSVNRWPGIGIWRQLDGFSLSANYVALLGNDSEDREDGASTYLSGGTATVQLAYSAAQWTIAAIYSRIEDPLHQRQCGPEPHPLRRWR
jgi:hypothetical protein